MRLRPLPVVIVVGAGSAIACGGDWYDSATGCCVSSANAGETSWHECTKGPHEGETCCANDSGGRIEDSGECKREG